MNTKSVDANSFGIQKKRGKIGSQKALSFYFYKGNILTSLCEWMQQQHDQ